MLGSLAKETHEGDEPAATPHADHHPGKPPFYARKIIPFLAFLAFIILFALIFLAHKNGGITQYNTLNQKSLAIREFGLADAPTIMGYFTTYGPFAGLLFGVFTLIISYILYWVLRLTRWDGAAGLSILLTYGLFAFYGYEFAYEGPGTLAWANGITSFLGPPLLWTGIILAAAGLACIILAQHHTTKGAA